jgi:hypothetical protein
MNKSETGAKWPADRTLQDVILRFPLLITLLDDGDRAPIVNDRLEKAYGGEMLYAAALQDRSANPSLAGRQ